jgi:hypothetical protein
MWKRLAILGGSVLIVAAILVAVYYQQHNAIGQGYDIKCVQPSEPPLASASLACKIYQSQNAEQGHPSLHWWNVLIAWPEGITAWLLLLTLGAIVWQSWSLHEQTRHMINKERARIDVSFPLDPLELDDGPEWMQGLNVVHAGTRITVANMGETNAFNVMAKAMIIGSPDGGFLTSKTSMLDVPGTLKAGTDPVTVDVITLLQGVNHVAAVNDRSEVLYLDGNVAYEDVFGNKRITPFRYRWDVDVMHIEGKSVDMSQWKKTAHGNQAT